VFPCDSGAFHDNLFHPHLSTIDIARLELDPSIEAIRRYVDLLFVNNGNYFVGQVAAEIDGGLDDVGRRLHKLLRSQGPAQHDDRRSAIEVQVRVSVDLRHRLLYVILPRQFLDDLAIRRAIFTLWNCEALPYPTFQGGAPADYYPVIRDRLFETLKRSTRI